MTLFASLAEPSRREILNILIDGETTVNTLVDRMTLSQPSVSKHLKVLREANLVTQRIDGQRRWYALNNQPLQELDQWLAPFRQQWSRRLDALGQHLDQTLGDEPTQEQKGETT